MSYRINTRGQSWGLIHRASVNGEKKDTRIKQGQLSQYGFRPDMTVEEAKARASQLNAETRYDRDHERSKLRALNQHNLEQGLESKHFPPVLLKDFEENRLKARFAFGGDTRSKLKKATSRWRFARRTIIDLDLKPEDWADEPRRFYAYFVKKQISLDYVSKVISVLNMWGHYVAKHQGRAFLPIPSPRGYDREAIADAYSNAGKNTKASLPLTPEMLASHESGFERPEWRWLQMSMWFGLRPKEIDGQLKVMVQKGRKVLAVYQSKLTTLAKDKRWKYIPIKYKEQEHALALMEEGPMLRPSMWKIAKVFGEGFTTYAGRKGFTRLMKSKGEPFQTVSRWLGHQDVNITHRIYDDASEADWGKAS